MAKLEPCELIPLTQPLYYSNELIDKDTIRIIEVTPELAESLYIGKELVIRGDEADSAVLCSETKTYEIKEAETSNTFLLLDKISSSADCKNEKISSRVSNAENEKYDNPRVLKDIQIRGAFSSYLELLPCSPKTSRIRMVLQQPNVQYDCFNSPNDPMVGIALSELQDRIQCSSTELKLALNELQAIKASKKINPQVDYVGERIFMVKDD